MIAANGLQSSIKGTTREDLNKDTATCLDHTFFENSKTKLLWHANTVQYAYKKV